jgi:hypothetical protein
VTTNTPASPIYPRARHTADLPFINTNDPLIWITRLWNAHNDDEKGGISVENKSRRGNYKGTTHMKAPHQDMAFVNDTLENTKSVAPVPSAKKETD